MSIAFQTCIKHPRYMAIRKPTSKCRFCMQKYKAMQRYKEDSANGWRP